MLKIVKGYGYGFAPSYSVGEPVKIDNKVYIPGEDEETGEFISAEEMRKRDEEEKAAEEKRFNESVDAKVSKLMAERSAALEQERSRILEQAKNEAANTAAEAKAATMAVMERAQRECAILKEQAKKEGYDEGFAEGRTQSLDKYKKCVDAAGKLLSEINSRKEAYYISCETEMRETVFELVQKIVRTELRTNPKVIESIIADAAKNFRNSDYLKITLAEDEITERFRTDEKLVKELIPFIPELELELDRDAEEGTVIEDDGSQIVDAGVPTQLEFLKEVFKNARGESDEYSAEGLTVEPDGADTLEASAEKSEAEIPKTEDPVKAVSEVGEIPEASETDETPNDGDDIPSFAEIMKAAAAEVSEAAKESETETASEEVPETLFDITNGETDKTAAPSKKSARKTVRKTKPQDTAAENAE